MYVYSSSRHHAHENPSATTFGRPYSKCTLHARCLLGCFSNQIFGWMTKEKTRNYAIPSENKFFLRLGLEEYAERHTIVYWDYSKTERGVGLSLSWRSPPTARHSPRQRMFTPPNSMLCCNHFDSVNTNGKRIFVVCTDSLRFVTVLDNPVTLDLLLQQLMALWYLVDDLGSSLNC